MREPKQLIEECKKHLRDTEQYKHEYKKDIRKLITALEKQLLLHDVVKSSYCECESDSEQLVCDNCYDTDGFYLGTTCPKCKQPFRSVKAN